MISTIEPTPKNLPFAKSIHSFEQAAGAKWVPVNKSFITLTRIILRSAAERLNLATLAVTLRCITHQGYRHLVLVNDDKDIQLAAIGRAEEFIIASDITLAGDLENKDLTQAASLPISFGSQRLGYLLAQSFASNSEPLASNKPIMAALQDVCAEIVNIIKRYQTRHRAIYVYGDQSYWIGNSDRLRKLDQEIDALARVNRPIVIRGDKGTGKIIAARSIHCLRFSAMVPFIESDCREWQDLAVTNILDSLHTYAKGGTLLLRNIDKLSPPAFSSLQEFFHKSNRYSHLDSARLIFTLSSEHAQGAPDMDNWLDTTAINLRLPRLHERREDIRDLARFFIRELGLAVNMDLTDDAWKLLEMLHWQENVTQLKTLIQTLCLVCEEPPISLELLEQYLPPQSSHSSA